MISSLSLSKLQTNSTTGFRTQIRPETRHSVTCIASTAAPPFTSSTLYDVLGVKSGATCHEIKAAYRRLVRQCHPDTVGDDQKADSADEFMRVHAAYATLSDPDKRADYDRSITVAAARRSRWTPLSRSAYRRSSRTWETDQCW